MKIKFEDLELAYESSSMCFSDENAAYLCKKTGIIYYDSGASKDALPEDIDTNSSCIRLPNKWDMDLGKLLVFSFIEEFMPSHMQEIYKTFRRKGSYSSYKLFLNTYRPRRDKDYSALLFWACTI